MINSRLIKLLFSRIHFRKVHPSLMAIMGMEQPSCPSTKHGLLVHVQIARIIRELADVF